MSNSPTNYPLANWAVWIGALWVADYLTTWWQIASNLWTAASNVVWNIGWAVQWLVSGTGSSVIPVAWKFAPLATLWAGLYAWWRWIQKTREHWIIRWVQESSLTFGWLTAVWWAAWLMATSSFTAPLLATGLGIYWARKTYQAGSQFLEHPVENTLHIPKKLFSWSWAALNRLAFGKNRSATA